MQNGDNGKGVKGTRLKFALKTIQRSFSTDGGCMRANGKTDQKYSDVKVKNAC